MSILQEFKEFAIKGNAIDMAVGIIMGAAFGKIISSLVAGVIMPPIGMLIGGVDFAKLAVTLKEGSGSVPAVTLDSGNFVQTLVDLPLFCHLHDGKADQQPLKKKTAAPAAPPEPSKEELLLTEIRDLLKAKN
jgi:large conductance mechanosensitive channel